MTDANRELLTCFTSAQLEDGNRKPFLVQKMGRAEGPMRAH